MVPRDEFTETLNTARKHLLVTFFILCYGVLSIPAYWLQDPTNKNFQSLTDLYIVFNIVTLILIAVLNIYIPHCMRKASAGDDINSDNAGKYVRRLNTLLHDLILPQTNSRPRVLLLRGNMASTCPCLAQWPMAWAASSSLSPSSFYPRRSLALLRNHRKSI